MPYIDPVDQQVFTAAIETLALRIDTPGKLNYVITRLVTNFIDRKAISYAGLNEAIGVLECAKLELYRRKVAPYEEIKKQDNGDVY